VSGGPSTPPYSSPQFPACLHWLDEGRAGWHSADWCCVGPLRPGTTQCGYRALALASRLKFRITGVISPDCTHSISLECYRPTAHAVYHWRLRIPRADSVSLDSDAYHWRLVCVCPTAHTVYHGRLRITGDSGVPYHCKCRLADLRQGPMKACQRRRACTRVRQASSRACTPARLHACTPDTPAPVACSATAWHSHGVWVARRLGPVGGRRQ
jgi:hypothetical protein